MMDFHFNHNINPKKMKLITTTELGELTPTKSNVEVVSADIAKVVHDGNADPVEFAVRCKFAIEVLTKAMDSIKEIATEKLKSSTTFMGAKVEVVEVGTKYNYSQDHVWKDLKDMMAPLEVQLKNQEERIKMATKIGASLINEDTGEVIATKVEKSSTTSIKITLGK